jgi:hypothetical protein
MAAAAPSSRVAPVPPRFLGALGVTVRAALRTTVEVWILVIAASIALDFTRLPLRPDTPGMGWPYPFPLLPDTPWFQVCDVAALSGVVVLAAAHLRSATWRRLGRTLSVWDSLRLSGSVALASAAFTPAVAVVAGLVAAAALRRLVTSDGQPAPWDARRAWRVAGLIALPLFLGALVAVNLAPVDAAPGWGSSTTWEGQVLSHGIVVRNRGWFSDVAVLGVDERAVQRSFPGWRLSLRGALARPLAPGRVDALTLRARPQACTSPVAVRHVPLHVLVRGHVRTVSLPLRPPLAASCG